MKILQNSRAKKQAGLSSILGNVPTPKRLNFSWEGVTVWPLNVWKQLQMLKSVQTDLCVCICVCVCVCVCCSASGKIISIETSALRATGRPGWEDLVRKCIYAFFQPQGKEPSHAKKLLHEGEQSGLIVRLHSNKSLTHFVPALSWLPEFQG